MWEIDYKEGWVPKNWCLWTVVLEKTLESPLDCKKIKPVNLKGNQHWIFIGRMNAKAEALILWPHAAKSRLTGKDPDAGKDWDGWMASPTQWTWIWANSGRWWRTGKLGVLQSTRLQRLGHNLVTEQRQWSWEEGRSPGNASGAPKVFAIDFPYTAHPSSAISENETMETTKL